MGLPILRLVQMSKLRSYSTFLSSGCHPAFHGPSGDFCSQQIQWSAVQAFLWRVLRPTSPRT
jgi:hypothetical protein